MTCIVGLVTDGKVYMGADSAATGGWVTHRVVTPKLHRNGDMLFGYTSSFRFGQLLCHAFTIPDHPAEMDTYHYLCTLFVDAMRACLKDGGYAKKDSEHESGGTVMIGYQGRLFYIQDDYSVMEPSHPYYAVGSGAETALGAMYVTSLVRPATPEERITCALMAAEEFIVGVSGPFTIECLSLSNTVEADI